MNNRFYQIAKMQYGRNPRYNNKGLANAVLVGRLTKEQYKEITGEEYEP